MLTKMEKKGVVSHRSEGRQFIYVPTVEEAEVQNTMVNELTERAFGGDPVALVAHLLEADDIDRSELARLSELIAEHKRAARPAARKPARGKERRR